jgi:TRAP-type mannitol/chloroaromatic compound transport system permease large subunit
LAKDDETALMLLNEKQGGELRAVKAELSATKRGMPGMGMLGIGGMAALTGAVVGGAEGLRTGGDPAAEKAIQGIGPGLALLVGVGGAIGFGAGAPKLRAASAGVGIAGAVMLARDLAKAEGIQMNLEAAAAKAKAAAAPQIGSYGKR